MIKEESEVKLKIYLIQNFTLLSVWAPVNPFFHLQRLHFHSSRNTSGGAMLLFNFSGHLWGWVRGEKEPPPNLDELGWEFWARADSLVYKALVYIC